MKILPYSKKLHLFIPDTRHGTIIYQQVKKYCEDNGQEFTYRTIDDKKSKPRLIVGPSEELIRDSMLSRKDAGDLAEEIIGFKDINLFLLNNRKTNQKDYFAQKTPLAPLEVNNNWPRKLKAEPDDVKRFTAGAVIMLLPVHLNDSAQCLNPEKPEKERTYLVKNSPKPYRKFDGQHCRHCSRCPFPEGCVMCTLP